MKTTTIFSRMAAATLVLLLSACSEDLTGPTGPSEPSLAIVPGPDELYLIDNICPTSLPNGGCEGFGNGSVLYKVNLTGGPTTQFVYSLTNGCVTGNAAINCDTRFDRAHIAATPDGASIYVVQSEVSGAGNPVGVYDIAAGTFAYKGEIAGIGGALGRGVVLAGFDPQGFLFVANQNEDEIYKINPVTLAKVQTWTTTLDLDGADLTFDAYGNLFVYTNAAGVRGLYKLTFAGANANAAFIGNYGDFHTGLAVRAGGTGNIVMSNAFTDVFREVDQSNGDEIALYPMTGALTDHRFGDMASGRIITTGGEGCTPGYWKNHTDRWEDYAPSDLFDAVFGPTPKSDTETLLTAVGSGGGGWNALGRHAVAALLNASNPDVSSDLTVAEVIGLVQTAAANPGQVEAIKNQLAALNEQGCPLGGTSATK